MADSIEVESGLLDSNRRTEPQPSFFQKIYNEVHFFVYGDPKYPGSEYLWEKEDEDDFDVITSQNRCFQ